MGAGAKPVLNIGKPGPVTLRCNSPHMGKEVKDISEDSGNCDAVFDARGVCGNALLDDDRYAFAFSNLIPNAPNCQSDSRFSRTEKNTQPLRDFAV